MQLAGHLRERALQEWNLLAEGERASYAAASQALQGRLDPGGRALAAQDFRHTTQNEAEAVSDFVRRLERTFQIAYGKDKMSAETRDTLLHSQLQEGLRYEVMRAPAVSGAQTYHELCLAAKNKEKRLANLRKRQHYQRGPRPSLQVEDTPSKPFIPTIPATKQAPQRPPAGMLTKRCHTCNQPGHLARDCRARRSESRGQQPGDKSGTPSTRTVRSSEEAEQPFEDSLNDPLHFLYSSDSGEEDTVRQVRVTDQGSKPRCVKVQIAGVPMYGIIDSGADITIMEGQPLQEGCNGCQTEEAGLQALRQDPTYVRPAVVQAGWPHGP